MSPFGTKPTSRADLRMSAPRETGSGRRDVLRPIGGSMLLVLLQQMNAMTTSDDKAADRTKSAKLALAAGLQSRPCTTDDDISRKVLW